MEVFKDIFSYLFTKSNFPNLSSHSQKTQKTMAKFMKLTLDTSKRILFICTAITIKRHYPVGWKTTSTTILSAKHSPAERRKSRKAQNIKQFHVFSPAANLYNVFRCFNCVWATICFPRTALFQSASANIFHNDQMQPVKLDF